MKPYKPGVPLTPLPEVEQSKWFGAKKDSNNRPLDPDHPPERPDNAPTHYQVAPGIAMARAALLPGQRGKGGRPTKAQADQKAPDKGARNAVADVREETPPLHNMAPRRRNWEAEYNSAEQEIERKEATALLLARKERLEAIQEETLIRQSNRRLAMGFGAVGINAISALNSAVDEVKRRTKDAGLMQKLSLKELNQIIQTGTTVVSKAQQAIEAMAKAERYILRHPLEDGESEDDDMESMTTDDAMIVLQNLNRSLSAVTKIVRQNPEVVSVQDGEDNGSGS